MAKKSKFIRLYDLKKGSEIHGCKLAIDSKKIKDAVIIFDHVDGMYSYNTVNDKDGEQIFHEKGNVCVVHLGNSTLLKIVGDHYEIASKAEEANYKD